MINSLNIFFCTLVGLVDSNQMMKTKFQIAARGTQFIPRYSQEYPLSNASASSFLRCATQCFNNFLCRVFVYDESTLVCRLYQSDSTSGNVTSTASISSRVGTISYDSSLYINYNRTCDLCQYNRYLVCLNSRCQCPSTQLFWSGNICRNKFYYGDGCNSSIQCREDLNLSCIFGSCQLNTASKSENFSSSGCMDFIRTMDPC